MGLVVPHKDNPTDRSFPSLQIPYPQYPIQNSSQESRTKINPDKEPVDNANISKPSETDQILIRYNTTHISASSISQVPGAQILKQFTSPDLEGLMLVSIPNGSLQKTIQTISRLPGVRYAEPNYIWRISQTPNDPQFWREWGFQNTGQVYFEGKPAGISGADGKVSKAWDISTGSEGIVVAVLDTGIDYTHPDLAPNMWHGPSGEYGYDFVNHDSDPMDDNGHGTHCAGIISAAGNNGIGIAGVSWKGRLMSVKILNSDGKGTISDIVEGIEYAKKMGADVISCSFGGNDFSQTAYDTIASTSLVTVCAGGNSGKNNNLEPVYPASYKLPQVIGVAATTARDELASYSDYGTSLHIAAPGDEILSTYLTTGGNSDKSLRTTVLSATENSKYAYISGTSQATALVAGMCSLLKGLDTSLTPEKIRTLLVTYSDPIPSLTGKVAANGRVNLYAAAKALSSKDSIPLHTGWNFISIPRPLASGSDTAAIFTSISSGGHSLFSFESGNWRRMKRSDQLSVMNGYWIYSTKEDAVPLTYHAKPDSIVRRVTSGWNTYGLPGQNQITAKVALSPISSIWRYLITYNGVNQQYEDPIVNGGSGGSSDERMMIPFKGYWLYSAGDGTLTG